MESGHTIPLPLAMLLVFGGAKLLAEVFERLRQPGIVGEILAGVILGPNLLGWITPEPLLKSLADLGVMFLLFRVGLETKSSELLKVGGIATTVATAGVIVPMFVGWGLARIWGYNQLEALFVGAAFVATSVGITAQVLSAKGVLHLKSSQIILAAAVIDDVLGLIVLAIVAGAAKGKLEWLDLALSVALPVIFTVAVAHWGSHSVKKIAPMVESNLRVGEVQFNLSIVLLFTLALVAQYVGIAAIVGAFLAGMALGEHVGMRVHDLVRGTAELLVPFFLVGVGLNVELGGLRDGSTLILAVVLLVAAILTKLIGCGLGAWSLGFREALRIGIGMAPRGEVGMVVAQMGSEPGCDRPEAIRSGGVCSLGDDDCRAADAEHGLSKRTGEWSACRRLLQLAIPNPAGEPGR